jgi:ribonuclease R
MSAERSIIKIKQARYMEAHLGQKFMASVTGINDYGIWVQLDDIFVEGYLPFARMGWSILYLTLLRCVQNLKAVN